ncbi:MAG TPA: anthranilate synthase component I family protein [Fibrobacteria bacterium]|nr:anthranilate synthase component I family protein [Fibrobacteria bacterium]
MFSRLSRDSSESVFFDLWDGRWSIVAVDPVESRAWRFPSGVGSRPQFRRHPFLSELGIGGGPRSGLSGWPAELGEPPPFRGGWAGTLGYGTRLAIEHLPDRLGASWEGPHARLSRYPAVAAHHFETGTVWAFGDLERTRDWDRRLATSFKVPSVRVESVPVTGLSDAAYAKMVEEVRSAIGTGDVFQCNVARRWGCRFEGDPLVFYERVRAINPSPWGGVHLCADWTLLSNSPELLLRVRGRSLETRPIAGTHPRGRDALDLSLRSSLESSPKERAEHLMLVDLARNDLGRVSAPGSVRVPRFMGLEGYSHVWHIVSTVQSELADGQTAANALASVFPCGTITGAPRIRCMELIDALEPTPRGLYTGSLGWIAEDGDAEWNVLIRSATARDGELGFHAGAGIVWDSDPLREAAETRHKAAAWLAAAGGP